MITNKYIIARKKGEMASEVFHLKKDASINAINKSTIPWFIRWIKKIKTKEAMIKYHIEKIEKISNSRYFIIEGTIKNSIDELLEVSRKVSNKELEIYTENEVITLAEIAYKKISSPIWISVFAMKINLLEWMLIFILVVVLVNVI